MIQNKGTGMYITENNQKNFNWDEYFASYGTNSGMLPQINCEEYFANNRTLLREDRQKLSLALFDVLRRLVKGITIAERPHIVELGAGTGFLSRTLRQMYGGSIHMVDNCRESYQAFLKAMGGNTEGMEYEIADILDYNPGRKYDMAVSFGVIEHFKDKSKVILAHEKSITKNGYIIILVPMDSILTRLYYQTFPEKNLGYRELLTNKEIKNIMQEQELTVLNLVNSRGYVYDFTGVICQKA